MQMMGLMTHLGATCHTFVLPSTELSRNLLYNHSIANWMIQQDVGLTSREYSIRASGRAAAKNLMILNVCRCGRCGEHSSSTALCPTARFLSSKMPSLGRMTMMSTIRFGSATSATQVWCSSSCITHSMLGMTDYRIWRQSHAAQSKSMPC